jgi:putative acetyltransferase
MPLIRLESAEDHTAIRDVHLRAFAHDDEARLVALLRTGGFSRLSLLAETDDQVVGHILFSDLAIVTNRGTVPALALAPLAVVPEYQRQGIGSMMVREGLRHCGELGHRIVIVLGHPDYYPRFGFSSALAEPLRSPYAGPSFMALELVAGALDGIAGDVHYPPPFAMF